MSTYLIVSAEFLTTGGQDRANFALASYLARQGHRVHLVAHQVDDAVLREGDVTWHRAAKPLGSTYLGESFLQRIGTTAARELARDDARVITNGGNCDWPADASWVHYVHAAYERQTDGVMRRLRFGLYHRRFTSNERRAVARARVVIANSRRTSRDVERLLAIAPEKIHTIYYGIDPSCFHPAPDGPPQTSMSAVESRVANTVLFIGALGDRRKGMDVVLRAWQVLCSDPAWQARLLVVGSGAEVPRWKTRIAQAGLSDRVELLGFRTDIADLMRNSIALVSPTRYEAYGLAAHEALCCGVPAIVSAGAGVAERYPQDLTHLLLRDPEDADDLVHKIRACAEPSKPQRAALRRLADELRTRTWHDMAADIERLIESARRSPASQTQLVSTA
jgi:glycosyltransferase involved in cell wall biosynthesis